MEEIDIKIKPLNIIIFVLIFIVSATIVNGVNANIDENSIYLLKNLNKYEDNIEDMRKVVDNLRTEVTNEEKQISNYENENFFNEIIDINSKIEELKFYNGFTDVRGPGIMLRVSDSISEDENLDIMDKIVHDVDITILLNDLKSAGAEAIDVNSKRIVNISEVVCAGPVLKINGEAVPAPFVIRAVGDQEALYNVLTEEGTYAYDLKNKYGMEVAVIMSYNLSIPKFKESDSQVKYAQSVER
ncbi:MAG: DUF881 domain-containing protein [Sedimentibacter sp.]|uniref:DUF881 domain-containing protein n=1 Tax=Sedimentibacter sp. TaxID=1960295 RepID=UPI002981C04E|nr:DUF881 domain-containing protein [Sedimentibacter sp.]MDW5298714.1 DUF881 domain-containing protein [Sedimentibacter sp.]